MGADQVAPVLVLFEFDVVVDRAESLNTDGAVVRFSAFRVEEKGELREDLRSTALSCARDGRLSRIEFFPEEDVDAAIARLDELTTEG